MNTADCYALLDDASDSAAALSRLYTEYAGTLACVDAAGWPQVLDEMQAALRRGLYAVPVLSYELGSHLMGIDAHALRGSM